MSMVTKNVATVTTKISIEQNAAMWKTLDEHHTGNINNGESKKKKQQLNHIIIGDIHSSIIAIIVF